jgi:hypothetical protein
MTAPLYYLWNEYQGERRHGMKPVTLERARKVMVRANARNDGRIYWFEEVPAEDLRNEWLESLSDCNCIDGSCPDCQKRAAEVYAYEMEA